MKKRLCLILLLMINAYLFSQTFTIAVIPDTQNYTDYRYQLNSNPPYQYNLSDVYRKQINHIIEGLGKDDSPIIFAIHLGDNVLHQKEQISEWELADEIISGLDNKLPFGMVPGNHDYDIREQRKDESGKKFWAFEGDSCFKKYFGENSKHFNNKKWYVGSFNEGMNSAIIFGFKGQSFLFIGLEMEAGDDVLHWAEKIIKKYYGYPTIIATHEFISAYVSRGNVIYSDSHYRRQFDSNIPKDIWNKFIAKHSQIFIVLNGHSYDGPIGERIRIDNNEDGYPVYQMLSDYEGRTDMYAERKLPALTYGGDGWMRLLEFDLDKNNVHVRTYSPELERYELDEDSDFILEFNWDWEERFGGKRFENSDK